MQAAITAEGVCIAHGPVAALRDVSFAIPPGKITGLIGPSGSGKTTLIRAIIGAQRVQQGTLTVLGLPAGSPALRQRIGYVSQAPAVYTDLTVRQNLAYFAVLAGADKSGVVKVLEQVDLTEVADRMTALLSGGQLARVSLAVALLGKADLLVLDEPTVGLDPVLRRRLWKLFDELASEGRTLLISSHVMDEAEQCPELLLLREGRILSHGAKQELLRATRTDNVEDAFLRRIEEADHAR